MSYKISPLTVNPNQKSNIVSRVFVSQPSAEDEMLVGRLFLLIEIEIERAEDSKVIDFLISDAYQLYYENEALILRDRLPNLKPEIIFENTIAKLNRDIGAYLDQEKIRLKPGALNAVIGIIHSNKLFFAQTGESKALLFYRPKNKKGELLADYSLIDITEKTNDPTQELAQANKFFTNLIAGAVPSHGYFFFANQSLFEYLSKKQIVDIVTTLPPSGAAEQMKNTLEQTNSFVPFFGLIIKNTTGEHDAFAAPAAASGLPGISPVGAGRSSVNSLNLTQEKTEQLLSPSGFVNVKKWLNKLKPAGVGIKAYASDKARQFNISKERLNFGQSLLRIGQTILGFLIASFGLIKAAVLNLIAFSTDSEKRDSLIKAAKRKTQTTIRAFFGLADRFTKLNPKHKALVIVIGLSILGLLGNTVYSTIANRRQEKADRIAAASEQFTQKENQLEAALLYNNKEGAKTILSEMGTLVESLPNRTQDEKTFKAEFKKRYETKLDSIYLIVRLNDSTPLLEIPEEAELLVSDNGSAFAISSRLKTIWKLNTEAKTFETATNDAFPESPLVGASIDDPNEYYIGQNSVLSYKSETGQFSAFSIENPPSKIEAAAVYNNRLYAAGSSSIYRFDFDSRNNTFSNRQNWLREDATLGTFTSLAIDGRIYTIENGSVSKFSGGRRESITLDEVTPALQNPTHISVSADLDFMYILDPSNKRVLVYTKNGKYLAQYTGDMLEGLTSASVDQKNRLVYFLVGKQVFRIEAKHFQ